MHPPRDHLLVAIRVAFLATAARYFDLERYAYQYATLLALAGLEFMDVFASAEIREAISHLPPEGLHVVAMTMARALHDAGERRPEYWANRVNPFLRGIWPKDITLYTEQVVVALGRICVAADSAFPQALEMIGPWLRHVKSFGLVAMDLAKSQLSTRFPKAALELLDRIVSEARDFPDEHALQCLRAIKNAEPSLVGADSFQRLKDYYGRLGKQI